MNNRNSAFFDCSGFAARSDIEQEELIALFQALENDQAEFLKHEKNFRSTTYQWPRDPLHTWSRVWEYPYVYHQIKKSQSLLNKSDLNIIDFGSGVTFFPFALAKLGCNILCADIDPVCSEDIQRAVNYVQHAPGHINVAIIESGRIPLESESQDVAYCISVLEHIPTFEAVIEEMSRVLKPGGQLILTVDIDLRGTSELGVAEFIRLHTALEKYFVKMLPERPVHPSDLLTTANSPFHIRSKLPLVPIKQLIKSALRKTWINGTPRVGVYLGVYSAVLTKKGPSLKTENCGDAKLFYTSESPGLAS